MGVGWPTGLQPGSPVLSVGSAERTQDTRRKCLEDTEYMRETFQRGLLMSFCGTLTTCLSRLRGWMGSACLSSPLPHPNSGSLWGLSKWCCTASLPPAEVSVPLTRWLAAELSLLAAAQLFQLLHLFQDQPLKFRSRWPWRRSEKRP